MKIDIPKSKEKMRVVRKENYIDLVLDSFLYFFMICMFPFIAISELIKGFNKGTANVWIVFLVIIALIFGGLVFYSVLKINRLTRISGLSKIQNQKLLENAANNLGWTVEVDDDLMILTKEWGWASWDWGKEMTIIHDGNDMLVNCVSFGRRRLKSPFHWIANRKTINKLTAELKRLHIQAETQL